MVGIVRIAILSICLLNSCSYFRREPAPATPASEEKVKPPFVMDVVDELNDGKRLHVRLRLRSEGSWDPAGLAVRIAGLSNGNVVQEEQFVLAKLLEREGLKNTDAPGGLPPEVSFVVSLAAGGLTDYQVELLWGEDAAGVVAVAAPAVKPGAGLVLRELTWGEKRECAQPPCPLLVHLQGDLYNGGTRPIERAVFLVRFMPRGAAQGAGALGEQEVQVEGLNLKPGESRPLRMEIDRGIPEKDSPGVDPMIRIVSEE